MVVTVSSNEKLLAATIQKMQKRLKAIEEISFTCSTISSSDLIIASHKVLKPFCELTGADYGLVFLIKNPGDQLYVEAIYGLPEEYREFRNKRQILSLNSENVPENWPSVRSMLKKQIVIVKDITQTNVCFSKYFLDAIKPNKVRTVASIPIVINDKAAGAITQYFISPHIFDNEEISFMKTMANLITSTIERNSLLESAKESEKELVRANDILQKVNQELDSFVYIASHDLREPLRTVESFVSIIQDKFSKKIDKELEDYLSRIIKGTQRMRKLIEDLTQLSRAGRERENGREVVNLNNLLAEVKFELTAFLQNRNASIEPENDLPEVVGSKEKISSILKNLITNAIKFNKSEIPKIFIRSIKGLDIGEDKACICIEDNGIGIESKYYKKIFDLFHRLHTQEEYEGTGAGLAIVKKILEKYGCTIWVESKREKGSRFYFTLNR